MFPEGQGQGQWNSGTGACPLFGEAKSWTLCWLVLCPEEVVGSGVLKTACLLMGGSVSLPSWLFGLRCPSIGAYRLLGGTRYCY